MIKKLTPAERRKSLPKGWRKTRGRDAVEKTFRFADFNAAFSWMTAVALYAEKTDHHPEWHNVYATVSVTLTTHDAGGVSARDIAMAKFMERTAKAFGGRGK